jgi:hypothetical protein
MIALPHPIVLAPFAGAMPFGDMSSGSGSNETFPFNAAGDKIAIIFTALSTTPVDLLSFYITATTTAGTTGNWEATLENLTAGDPSGAVTNSATGTSTDTTTYVTVSGMAGTASLTAGTDYAVVLTAGSGWDRNITVRIATGAAGSLGYPVVKTKDSAGAWTTTINNSLGWSFGFADSGGTYMQIPTLLGAYLQSSPTFSSSTNPDERGNRFSLGIAARICGVHIMLYPGSSPGTANDDIEVKLLSSHTGTPVEEKTKVLEGEERGGCMAQTVMFGSGFDAAASTVYAVTVEALGSETQTPILLTYNSSAECAGVMGSSFYSTTRNDGGSCTDLNTAIYGIFPIISHFDDGAGGGGGGLAANPTRGFIA